MIESMTESEFLRFSVKVRHKKAAETLRLFHHLQHPRYLQQYRKIELWCELPRLVIEDFEAFSDRYHLHLCQAQVSWKEHNLLAAPYHQKDTASDMPFLPLAIYLDNLRSAFNVGSILRTTEAFRLGKVHFSQQTPFIDNPKVQKTSMWAYDKLPCEQCASLEYLPKPFIALETDPSAPNVLDFSFPSTFTLILGNEEYGLSKETLLQTDILLQIPMYGFKNSLNVASAYAITAAVISNQLRKK